jgi:hypothetical protein
MIINFKTYNAEKVLHKLARKAEDVLEQFWLILPYTQDNRYDYKLFILL